VVALCLIVVLYVKSVMASDKAAVYNEQAKIDNLLVFLRFQDKRLHSHRLQLRVMINHRIDIIVIILN